MGLSREEMREELRIVDLAFQRCEDQRKTVPIELTVERLVYAHRRLLDTLIAATKKDFKV